MLIKKEIEKLQTNNPSPVFLKTFEKIIDKDLFYYLHKNKLFSKCQAGFSFSNSCILQLFCYVHDINSSFDCNSTKDVRGVCFSISKASDGI